MTKLFELQSLEEYHYRAIRHSHILYSQPCTRQTACVELPSSFACVAHTRSHHRVKHGAGLAVGGVKGEGVLGGVGRVAAL